ncbi:RNA polymerase sigma-70 factor (ECF subfamily) [Brevibacterium sanguinis]|uniref:RNA polymerase sigma-70 factor (ECF subfamily) n=2 Tax=Brevibacterium TaxID=1696 RepID=A0A366IPG3_9MICO|nr:MULTISPECIES: RNA polymerase sigma factor SigJ [Brevibacterium]RBP67274.1 RNA polymerase sigma-70 factor (ECF subfamily) [Brevibacterium sanguinis]RBP73799.1 RNA polymerase sigma-70 factor (ECF subfamily) [Brevibacterium celere]
MTGEDHHADVFEEHRGTLLGAAYRVLGTVQDSEDAVQETWLRWTDVDLQDIRDPRSYLLKAVTRVALNIARSQSRRREEYPGPWLPEPVATGTDSEPGHLAEVAEEVSLALLVVLESLTDLERAAFVLREAFGLPYAEVAEALGRSETSTRQLVSRARKAIRVRAPRRSAGPDAHRDVTRLFLAAAEGSVPLEEVLPVLAPAVVLTTDAGGRAKAALNPITGAAKVLRFIAGVLSKPETVALNWELTEVNGAPAFIARHDRGIDSVVWLEVEGDVVTRIQMIRNPDKLRALRAH